MHDRRCATEIKLFHAFIPPFLSECLSFVDITSINLFIYYSAAHFFLSMW